MRETISKTREKVQKEFETHTQIKKDIEVWQREVENLLSKTNSYFHQL